MNNFVKDRTPNCLWNCNTETIAGLADQMVAKTWTALGSWLVWAPWPQRLRRSTYFERTGPCSVCCKRGRMVTPLHSVAHRSVELELHYPLLQIRTRWYGEDIVERNAWFVSWHTPYLTTITAESTTMHCTHRGLGGLN